MAFVLSSLSGNLISAASAGYAPTNSGDVSAIASSYQVVSATATQLNAGTAYVTSINDTPISAARAGNAANASLANSAWYDGTGRLISSLPDEATVSSIASSYAESAVSSKLDASASSDFYSTSNPSGFITEIDLSDYATTAYVDSSISSFVDSAYVESQVSAKQDKLTFGYSGMFISSINGSAIYDTQATGEGVNSATVSAIASAYAESAVSSKQDTLTFDWDANSAISSINGSALAGGTDSATVSSIASSYAESAVSSKLDTTAQVVTATAGDGTYVTAINGLGISGQGGGGGGVSVQTASARTMYSGLYNSAVTGFSGIDGVGPVVLRSGTVVAGAMKMQLGGIGTSVPYPSSFDGDQNYKWSTGNILLLSGSQGYGYYKGHQLWLCRGSGSTSHRISFDVNNTTADVMVYKNGYSAVITPTGFSIWGGGFRRSIDSAVYDRWNSYSAKQDPLVFAYTTDDQISSINGSALAGGGGGIDSATCSAIASSYTESAASSKLDASAASGFYTVDNPSGFITGLPQDITARYITAKSVSASSNVRAINTTADLYGNFDYAGMYFRSGSQRPYNIGIDNTGANFYIATAKNGFERIYASSIQNWNAKLDGSASSSFYTTANESGFIDDASASAIASSYVESGVSSKADQSAYDNLYSAFTALNDLISQYSAYFSSISAKVDNSAIGVIE